MHTCALLNVVICQFTLGLVRTAGPTPPRNLEINALPGIQSFHPGLPCFTALIVSRGNFSEAGF